MQQLSNRQSKLGNFSPGDNVLLFLLTPGNSLQSKFSGPYVVAKKLSPLNYIVHTHHRHKDTQLEYINLMKSYLPREPEKDSTTNMLPVAYINVLM